MKLLKILLCAAAAIPLAPALAQDFVVDAKANSSSGGVGLPTIVLAPGQVFTLTASTYDLWSAGALPRLADANGLVVNRISSPLDDTPPQDGTTLIGIADPNWTQAGFSAPYASLVGLVGSQYQLLGTNFTGSFTSGGTLQLFFWDENNYDNSGTITAHISTDVPSGVPEPATWAMMMLGFGGIGAALRRIPKAREVAAT